MDFLKSAVASAISKGPPFPYSFGDRVDLDQSIWTLHNGTRREDGSNCSIFSFDITTNRSRLPVAKNALRKLKTLRHPGIIRVLESVETEAYIYIATERVVPLTWHVRRKSLSEETCKWGLYTVASTLKFVNEEGSSVHGNIRVSSIFTSESGEWKIGGLDLLSSMKEDDAVIYTYAGMVPDINRYVPPEVSKSGWEIIKRNPLSATDAYQFGLLIFEVFNGGSVGSDTVGQTKNIPPSMQQHYKRLLNANPKPRLSTAHFLDQGRRSGGFFETPLIMLSEGIESLGLKNDTERVETLGLLDEVSDDFPEQFFKMKVLPELLKSVEFGGGGPKVFGYVMKIGAKLSDDEYESMLTPVLVRLFANPDRQIRVCLLDNLSKMIDHFPQKLVINQIFPQIVTGFTDIVPVVREQTVRSVLTLVAKLPDRTINGELLKHLAKTANDEQPGIRTNTTICLGKIARNLGPNTRGKVLIAAFTRSLRDPFVHARSAALQALAASSDLFSEEDCAGKILPALCPSLLDRERTVREQANKSFDTYLTRIRRHGETLPEPKHPAATGTASNGTTPRMGTPANANDGWTGWAISSFTNKLGGASGEIRAKSPNAAIPPGTGRPMIVGPGANGAPPAGRAAPSGHSKPRDSAFSPPPVVTADDNENIDDWNEGEFEAAWGEMGDMEDEPPENAGEEEGDDDSKGIAAAFAAPPPPSKTSIGSPTGMEDGEPDFAAWLNARAQTKSKGALPKGLAKKSTAPATGAGGAAAGAAKKKPIVSRPTPVSKKVIDTKPKQEAAEEDDGWGDAWD